MAAEHQIVNNVYSLCVFAFKLFSFLRSSASCVEMWASDTVDVVVVDDDDDEPESKWDTRHACTDTGTATPMNRSHSISNGNDGNGNDDHDDDDDIHHTNAQNTTQRTTRPRASHQPHQSNLVHTRSAKWL